MKTVTLTLGGYKISVQRFPTSRSVLPSQLQREKADADELTRYARRVIAAHARRQVPVE